MSDRDDRTEARVCAAFLSEQRRAEADVELNPFRRRRPSRRLRTVAGLATIALAVILAVVSVRLVYDAQLSASPSPPPTSSTVPALPSPTAGLPVERYDDGIPREFDGQPVLRWDDALARRETATDATSFLVGLWLDIYNGPIFCYNLPVNPSAPESWASNDCTGREISAEAGGPYASGQIASFRFAQGDFSSGPAILRVHLHDTRASLCGDQEAACDRMLVVESAVWTGDSYTDPRPYTVADVIAAAGVVEPATSLTQPAARGLKYPASLPGAVSLISASSGQVTPSDVHISGASLMPSVEAMNRALPGVEPGAAGAMLQSARLFTQGGSGPGYSYTVESRWLVVDNVAFLVMTASPPSAADEAWMASLEAALRATH
jgi:hypothetical protein